MVKVNDMFYGYSANEDIKAKGEYGGVVTTIMKYLLEENIVDGVVAVKEDTSWKDLQLWDHRFRWFLIIGRWERFR